MKCYPTPTSLCPRGVPRASGLQLGGTGDADGLWDALPSPPAPASCLLADGGQHCADTELGVLTALLPPAGKPDGQGPHRRLRGGACLTHRTVSQQRQGPAGEQGELPGASPQTPAALPPAPPHPCYTAQPPRGGGQSPPEAAGCPGCWPLPMCFHSPWHSKS